MTFFLLSKGPDRTSPCQWCHAPHTFLCDHPNDDGGTCSAKMCSLHVHEVAFDRHLCPDHREGVTTQLSLLQVPS